MSKSDFKAKITSHVTVSDCLHRVIMLMSSNLIGQGSVRPVLARDDHSARNRQGKPGRVSRGRDAGGSREFQNFTRSRTLKTDHVTVTDHVTLVSRLQPLNPNPDSRWNTYFKDNEVLLQIDKDVR